MHLPVIINCKNKYVELFVEKACFRMVIYNKLKLGWSL